jgi:hypothetical protein
LSLYATAKKAADKTPGNGAMGWMVRRNQRGLTCQMELPLRGCRAINLDKFWRRTQKATHDANQEQEQPEQTKTTPAETAVQETSGQTVHASRWAGER